MRDGRPWLPVMGEFHYSRYPESEWEKELLKMKAGGVDIVASYVIWIHHEEVKGQFDWSGQRNLRRFAELTAKHGLYFYPRIGPWSHAEVRRGGFPDWLHNELGDRMRSNDSAYLAYTDRLYGEIASQLRGLLWKDGGPIIGIQLENEYNQRGPNRGEEHILALKRLALKHGFDVPLYTVTGWDNTVVPPAEVIPVFGGYPDMPWDQSIDELPPGEVYAFRFANRWAGNLPERTPNGQLHSTAQAALTRYPFLGAEYGGGIQITYHRRPIISADDIAAMLPVQIGSGVNLYGYYMFHGGTNPEGKLTTLHEGQRTGYPTDVPVKSYDFQTLLSEFGEVRQSFRKVKLVHYFLNDFGEQLAPMVVRAPDRVPANTADTSMLRLAARTSGNSGFIFANNYIRNYPMPARRNVQVALQLPGETLRIPERPVDIPSGAYFIWPVNLRVGPALLKYSTAQLITRVSRADTTTFYFLAIPGITPEFVFAPDRAVNIEAAGMEAGTNDRVYIRNVRPGNAPAITLRTMNGVTRIVVLAQEQAEQLWRMAGRVVWQPPRVGREFAVRVEKTRDADAIGPVPMFNAVTWRKVEIALAPSDSAFAAAARYRISLPDLVVDDSSDVILTINYVGDVARLYAGDVLLNDNFYNGMPWRVSARRYADVIRRGPLELRILPLRGDAPVYMGRKLNLQGQRAELVSITATTVYEELVR
ncbi:MAG TPA: beta-galactosidase [Longimicrobiales bacterium]